MFQAYLQYERGWFYRWKRVSFFAYLKYKWSGKYRTRINFKEE